MKEIKVGVTFTYREYFFPTKRHKVEKCRKMVTSRDVTIKQLESKEFPIAGYVTDYVSLYPNAKEPEDFNGSGTYQPVKKEIRYYDGSFYKARMVSRGAAESTLYAPKSEVTDYLKGLHREDYVADNSSEFSEKSVISHDTLDEIFGSIQRIASEYLFCDGKVWDKCGEPVYEIQTFGLGNNHGGTGFFIEWLSEPEDPSYGGRYFRADERDKAVEEFKKTANGRGDTESLDGYKDKLIEVCHPEWLKYDRNRNRKVAEAQKEEGAGETMTVRELIEAISRIDADKKIFVKKDPWDTNYAGIASVDVNILGNLIISV